MQTVSELSKVCVSCRGKHKLGPKQTLNSHANIRRGIPLSFINHRYLSDLGLFIP
jgi:hypothetical protein